MSSLWIAAFIALWLVVLLLGFLLLGTLRNVGLLTWRLKHLAIWAARSSAPLRYSLFLAMSVAD